MPGHHSITLAARVRIGGSSTGRRTRRISQSWLSVGAMALHFRDEDNSYARHRFPPDVIRYAVWLYLRFTLSYRDVEDLLAERGFDIGNETIRRWVRSSDRAKLRRDGCGA
jgi:putative transposase